MSDDHATTVDRLRQFRESITLIAMDRLTEAQRVDAAARGTLPVGQRVLDRISGFDGVVLPRSAAAPVLFGAVPVQLESGAVVERLPRDLFARPTPPSA